MTLNDITLVGRIDSGFLLDYEHHGYRFYVSVERSSKTADIIPVMISERQIDIDKNYMNEYVYIKGQYRSFNCKDKNRVHLILYVYPIELYLLDYANNINDIFLQGNLCKEPVYRSTPAGRKITDLLIAVNREYGKTDFIPCILWGRNAYEASKLHTGNTIRLAGRIQSRNYEKDGYMHTDYEVSANLFEVVI